MSLVSRALRTDATLRQKVRFFSSSMSPPYHIFGISPRNGNLMLGDLRDFLQVEKKVSPKLLKPSATIGASHGWVATLKNGVLCLLDDLNPLASDTNPKRISLPGLVTLPQDQADATLDMVKVITEIFPE